MSFNSAAVYDKLVEILNDVVQRVYQGVPESVETDVSAYIVLAGSPPVVNDTTSVVRRELSFRISFLYRVSGEEADVERSLMLAVDDFIMRFYDDRTLGDTWEGHIELDLSEADTPDYRAMAGQEFRQYPVIVRGVQRANTAL